MESSKGNFYGKNHIGFIKNVHSRQKLTIRDISVERMELKNYDRVRKKL